MTSAGSKLINCNFSDKIGILERPHSPVWRAFQKRTDKVYVSFRIKWGYNFYDRERAWQPSDLHENNNRDLCGVEISKLLVSLPFLSVREVFTPQWRTELWKLSKPVGQKRDGGIASNINLRNWVWSSFRRSLLSLNSQLLLCASHLRLAQPRKHVKIHFTGFLI